MVSAFLSVLQVVTAWGAILFGLLAAGLWFKSTENVLYTREEAKRDHDLINYPATMESQSRWNRRAAAATAVSLLLQAVFLLLQQLTA